MDRLLQDLRFATRLLWKDRGFSITTLATLALCIAAMVLREGAAIVLIGAGLGLTGAFLLRQTLQSQLYEVGAMDPRVITSVALVLLAVALTACLLPARKAARTDPVVALTEQ